MEEKGHKRQWLVGHTFAVRVKGQERTLLACYTFAVGAKRGQERGDQYLCDESGKTGENMVNVPQLCQDGGGEEKGEKKANKRKLC